MIINNSGTGIGNAGILVINDSAVIGNKNGGIYNEGWYGINGKATLNNTTLGGNSSPRWYGGGLVNNGYGTVILNNSTVSHNSATDGGGIYNGPYGSTVTLKDSIVANNTGNFSGPDCRGQIISSGFNLMAIPPAVHLLPAQAIY